jgi:hypothetical protein
MIWLADIPEKWTDIPEKIKRDVVNLPFEINDTARNIKDLTDDMHNIRVVVSDMQNFIDKLRDTYEGLVDFLNTPIFELVDSINLPVTYLCITVGALLLMFGLPKWGSKLCKIGGLWFLVSQIVMAISRGLA